MSLWLPDFAPADLASQHVAEVPDPALALAQLEHAVESKAAAIRDRLHNAPVVGQHEGGARLPQDDAEGGSATGDDASGSGSGSEASAESEEQ
ncbi:hypothetical protein Rsub_12216 [Raphidocelis subcapitata]|uniref:Uncharacterized protein n=1 Tax=Raphidocelis subcapitata TaxID=307507 RepID=A0A2V0PIF3_9CHLO|nr:hypothetical protein Rsub_12216 [Raphidocelis subcapitata]|eukprot:GBF99591.1 hypothetical protein Rsub_12216 [Raphidocelis subcapitata]